MRTVPQHDTFSYTEHARSRMVDRAIYKKQVRRTVRRPDRRYAQTPNLVAEYSTSKGIIIRVVYHLLPDTPSSVQVVTAVRFGKLRGALQRESITTHYDRAHDVAYVSLLSGRITETFEVASGVYYDVDAYGEVLGVEILNYSHYRVDEDDSRSIFERLPVLVR